MVLLNSILDDLAIVVVLVDWRLEDNESSSSSSALVL